MPPCTDGRLLAWVELSPRTLDLNLDQRKIASGHALEAEISSPEYSCKFSLMFLNIRCVPLSILQHFRIYSVGFQNPAQITRAHGESRHKLIGEVLHREGPRLLQARCNQRITEDGLED